MTDEKKPPDEPDECKVYRLGVDLARSEGDLDVRTLTEVMPDGTFRVVSIKSNKPRKKSK